MPALITINYNDVSTTEDFIRRVTAYHNISRIIVVDNHSTDDSLEKLYRVSSDKVIILPAPRNGGYAYGNNLGIRKALSICDEKYLIISNSDVSFAEETVDKMMDEIASHPNLAVIAPTMKDSNGIVCSNVASNLPTYGDLLAECFLGLKLIRYKIFHKSNCLDYETIKDLKIAFTEVVPGSFFLIDVKKLQEIGFFDEKTFLYCEENILGYHLKQKGYREAILPQEYYLHQHGSSVNQNIHKWSKQEKILHDSEQEYLDVIGAGQLKKKLHSVLFYIGLPERCLVRRLIQLKKKG